MRTWLLLILMLAAVTAPAKAFATTRVMSLVEWLNHEVRQSNLALIGQVADDTFPHVQTGVVKPILQVGEIYHGPKVGPRLTITIKPGYRNGQYTMPAPLLRDQWVLIFLKSEGGRWTAPTVGGRVVETPFKGLTFYPGTDTVLSDVAPSLSWKFVLDSLAQIVAVRREIINGHLPRLRAARTKEQRDRVKLSIEWQVKEQLGLPVP